MTKGRTFTLKLPSGSMASGRLRSRIIQNEASLRSPRVERK